ncbi:MAG: hypothetical protein Hyperionvirus5_16 [Hyperionvirus sp.]|uniref:Uncharacterized protein n=1 Tax=Hyperionvirus sp. TaxID=2487770 RepID=A0A3G5A7G0_9VIRU|nr:MAG: hypothetical protein Hyperionvirus5_16 [Hyperionvirus sp.]
MSERKSIGMLMAASFDAPILTTRLRPILLVTMEYIIVVDFLNGRLTRMNKSVLRREFYLGWDGMDIHREDNQIYVDLHWNKSVGASFKIDLGIPHQVMSLEGSSGEKKQISQLKYDDGSCMVIDWGDNTLLNRDRYGLTITEKGEKKDRILFTNNESARLVKLHPRANDPTGFYKKYFCFNDGNYLLIGTICDDKLCAAEKIIDQLFEDISLFCLTGDNLLMLLLSDQLVFVDCNEVTVVGRIELEGNIPISLSHHIFTELSPIRKDFIMLEGKFRQFISAFILAPLAGIVFTYIFGDMP